MTPDRTMRALVLTVVACGGDGGGGSRDAAPGTNDSSEANACYIAGNSGTGAANDTDCCFGLQCMGSRCRARGGAICSGNQECASNNCNGTTCVAKLDGESCSSTIDCSATSECRDNLCCRQGGAICNVPSECCSGSCKAGQCECVQP